VRRRTALAPVLAVLAATLAGACGDSTPTRDERVTDVLQACRDKGGVKAFDDDALICGNGTSNDERGAQAVDACRAHRGVAAFDDDIVVCEDQTVHGVEGG
jgi:hypothetical protein